MKKLGLLAAGLLLAGCATLEMNNLDWIPIGPDFPPTKAKNVEIIGSKSDITRPYGNLGLLRIKNLQPTRDNLKMGVEKGRKFVASKGADAMLIGQYNSAEDGASNPRVTLIIYAIKYVDNLSEEDEKAIEDFKVLGILNERSDS
ncbi:MAG: hypothetical protein MR039_06290 [Elusimicrobia bacterium]|jgi:hypothetical protein|uniref:hypothetical protein n=1 Tax=Candidatus Avelusimicrobium fimicolum TaxID=3416216 RepID=UPI002A8BF389|nr:hypothetical protein [Elusimicrobiota bacterium]MDY3911198.1 hypothetical protein [Elusimicrobiaceae bacterium]